MGNLNESPADVDGASVHRIVMRSSTLQDLVVKLSNGCWCRYWLHHNYPNRNPWVMAIECRQFGYDESGKFGLYPVKAGGMEELGFGWDEEDKRYYIDRDVIGDGLNA